MKSHSYNPLCNTSVCISASSRIVRGYKQNTEASQRRLALPRKHVAFQAFAGECVMSHAKGMFQSLHLDRIVFLSKY
jgi:hypothetical protein